MKKLLLLIIVSLTLTGVANANSWSPFVLDPNFPLVEAANWNVAANWSDGTVPVSTDVVQFGNDTVGCLIDGDTVATNNKCAIGDNGGDALVHRLTILDGGVWNTGALGTSWTTAGYNREAHITVERGGAIVAGHRFGIGLVGNSSVPVGGVSSSLNVNGGTMTIDGNLQIGSIPAPNGHVGTVNVYAGTLEATGWEWRDTTGVWSFMDIMHGTVTVDGDVTSDIPALLASGALTAFGEQGDDATGAEIEYAYASSVTTITATDPMARYPAMDEWVADGGLILSWTNLDSIIGFGVYVDVWFGTDTDYDDPCYNRILTQGFQLSGGTGTLGTSTDPGTYYWQVDTYAYGSPASVDYKYPDDPNQNPWDPRLPIIVGDQIVFYSTDDEPPVVVITTLPTATWANEPTTLEAIVDDDGTSMVTVTWSVDEDDPNITWGAGPVGPSGSTINGDYVITIPDTGGVPYSDPVSTIMQCNYHAAQVIVTASVIDALNTGNSVILPLDVADNPCQAARAVMGYDRDGDVDENCVIDLADLLRLAVDWLYPYELTEPTEIPQ